MFIYICRKKKAKKSGLEDNNIKMVDNKVALEALSAICKAEVTSVLQPRSEPWYRACISGGAAQPELTIRQQSIKQFFPNEAEQQPTSTRPAQALLSIKLLSIKQLIPAVLDADVTQQLL